MDNEKDFPHHTTSREEVKMIDEELIKACHRKKWWDTFWKKHWYKVFLATVGCIVIFEACFLWLLLGHPSN